MSPEYQPYDDENYSEVAAYVSPHAKEEDNYYEETSECIDDLDCDEGEECNEGTCKSK